MFNFFESKGFFNGIILSGTDLSMEQVKDAVGSLSAREAPSNRIFTDVGRFTRDDSSQETYINRYLNLSKDNISDQRLLERMRVWFSGRYVYYSGLQDSFSSLIIVTA
jgi:spore coat protein CotH